MQGMPVGTEGQQTAWNSVISQTFDVCDLMAFCCFNKETADFSGASVRRYFVQTCIHMWHCRTIPQTPEGSQMKKLALHRHALVCGPSCSARELSCLAFWASLLLKVVYEEHRLNENSGFLLASDTPNAFFVHKEEYKAIVWFQMQSAVAFTEGDKLIQQLNKKSSYWYLCLFSYISKDWFIFLCQCYKYCWQKIPDRK